MNLKTAFGPQISPINADGSGHYLVSAYHLPGEPMALATSLFHLRHLRIELRFLSYSYYFFIAF